MSNQQPKQNTVSPSQIKKIAADKTKAVNTQQTIKK